MTALQELKEYIEDQINKATINNYQSASNIANARVIRNVRIAVNTLTLHKIERLLKIEKQQILYAFNEGMDFSSDYFIPPFYLGEIIPEADNYFKQTYDSITTTNE